MHRRNDTGVTLVELAIVLVVIGLLIAAILKGQELIANSAITSTISEMENISAAVDNFHENYGDGVYPGDMANASFRLEGCNADPCNNGNGDGFLNVGIGEANTATGEGAYFFGQLRAAELLTGFDGAAVASFGRAFPASPIGGGYMVGDTNEADESGFDLSEMQDGKYLLITGRLEDIDGDSGILTPAQAGRIDRTLDNGRTDSGGVIAQNTGNTCRNAANPENYAENQAAQVCVIAYRLPQ